MRPACFEEREERLLAWAPPPRDVMDDAFSQLPMWTENSRSLDVDGREKRSPKELQFVLVEQ